MRNQHVYMMMWLPRKWVPFDVIKQLYNIDLAIDKNLKNFLEWSLENRKSREIIKPTRNEVNRHALETFLQRSELLPIKIAAAHLGMTNNSFIELLDVIKDGGLISLKTEHYSPQVVSESFIRTLPSLLPNLKHKVFGDHDNYCKNLHLAIKKNLGLKVEGLYCITSQSLGEKPADYAYEFDCITGDPVGLRYSVWLDFKKPLYLRPDVCSQKFYLENKKILKRYLFLGKEPEIAKELREAVSR